MPLLRPFTRTRQETAVRAVYEAIVAAARHPHLYAAYGVPDTIDGRFDMIILHAVLVLERLTSMGAAETQFSQRLTDYLFADMDRSLREMGVGDLSVGKKVRRMAEVFYGRAQAHAHAFESDSQDALAEALRRNVAPEPEHGAERLAGYAFSIRDDLRETETASILAGRLEFREPRA
jgi:cytochrome b pre-mRNA-processing protein 3